MASEGNELKFEFERDGVVAPIDLLDPGEVAEARAAFAAMEATCGPIARADQLHLHFGWARRLVSHPRLLAAVAALIGDDLLVRGVLLFCKHAGQRSAVPWHQDSVYSGWHLSPSVSAWIALTPSTERSGCMRVIVGSHHEGLRPHAERPGSSVLLRRGETVVEAVDETRARSLVLAPGQASLHHCNLIHGSGPNDSDHPRIGFIVRFVTSAHRVDRGPVLRVAGHGDDRHLDRLESDPEARELGQEIERWRQAHSSRA